MTNDVTNILPKWLARGVLALRQQAVGPRLVNRDFDQAPIQIGNVLNIPIPSAITARAVTPSVVMNSNVASAPTVALVTMDHWYEAPFEIGDNDFISADMGSFFPMQASEAVKALANDADAFLMGKSTAFYGQVGTGGTTPFASGVTNANSARTLLNKQLAPLDNRRAILDAAAEGALLGTTNVLQFDQRGDQGGIVQGSIGTKLGFDWYMDQNVVTYTLGGAHANGLAGGWAVSGANAVAGVYTITVVHASVTGTIKAGDVFTVNGASQQYVITANATITVTASERSINFYPALATTVASAVAVTFVATGYVTTYTANLAFHRDAFVWASRPLGGLFSAGNIFQGPNDPISGIALRLELSRQYKLETLSYDYLAGAGVPRRELGVKILG